MDSFALSFARLASRAKRAGIDGELLDTLTVGEALLLIKEADRERKQWDRLADARSASLMALIANCHRRKGAKAFKPADFMAPDDEDDDGPEPTEAELEQHFINMAKTLGAN